MVALATIVAGLYLFVVKLRLVAAAEFCFRRIYWVWSSFRRFSFNADGLVSFPHSLDLKAPILADNENFRKTGSAKEKSENAPASETVSTIGCERLTREDQWNRISIFLSCSVESARTAGEMHTSAARQLDAVDYEYLKMIDELGALMPEVAMARVAASHAQRSKSVKDQIGKPARAKVAPSSMAA